MEKLEALKGEALTFKKLRQLEHSCGNPGRPTKEFWSATYPGILADYSKKYPKKEAEQRARKATGAIWYRTMSASKKAEYERVRRKREGA